MAWENTEIINDYGLRQKAIKKKKNGKNTSNKKGLEKMHNCFKMKMVWKENRDKGINHQNVIGKKNAFGFPDKWQIRIAFLQISQASFT